MKNFISIFLLVIMLPFGCKKEVLEFSTQEEILLSEERSGGGACITQSALDAGCIDPEQNSDMSTSTCNQWRQFEINVCCTKYSNATAKAAQVKLEVDVPGVGKKTIIADILVKLGNTWKIAETKTSATTDLRTVSMSSRCTANQNAVYPHLNSGARTAKVVGFLGNTPQTGGLTVNGTVNLAKGVDFYINYPAGTYEVSSIYPRTY